MATKKAAKKGAGKAVPKKPTQKQLDAEAKKKEAAAQKETALVLAPSAKIVPVQKDPTPEGEHSDSFKKKAEAVDRQIRQLIGNMEANIVTLGRLGLEMKDKGYLVVLGYDNLGNYFNDIWPVGKSTVFAAMKVVRELGTGETPILKDDEMKGMKKTNLEGLAALKANKVEVTPEIISAAKTMPIQEFKEKVILPNSPEKVQHREAAERGVSAPAGAAQIQHKVTHYWSTDLLALANRTLTVARSMVADDDRTVSLDDKAWEAIFGDFLAENEAEYHQKQAEKEAQNRYQALENDRNGLHHSTVIAEVEDEEIDDLENDIPVKNIIPDDIPDSINGGDFEIESDGTPAESNVSESVLEQYEAEERTIELEPEFAE